MKELQKLMKHNGNRAGLGRQIFSASAPLDVPLHLSGFDFLTPVIGFYCQKCEEFFGDWKSAENHAAVHRCPCSSVSLCA